MNISKKQKMNFKILVIAISMIAARLPWSDDFNPLLSGAGEKLRAQYEKMSVKQQNQFWLRRVSFEKVRDISLSRWK